MVGLVLCVLGSLLFVVVGGVGVGFVLRLGVVFVVCVFVLVGGVVGVVGHDIGGNGDRHDEQRGPTRAGDADPDEDDREISGVRERLEATEPVGQGDDPQRAGDEHPITGPAQACPRRIPACDSDGHRQAVDQEEWQPVGAFWHRQEQPEAEQDPAQLDQCGQQSSRAAGRRRGLRYRD